MATVLYLAVTLADAGIRRQNARCLSQGSECTVAERLASNRSDVLLSDSYNRGSANVRSDRWILKLRHRPRFPPHTCRQF